MGPITRHRNSTRVVGARISKRISDTRRKPIKRRNAKEPPTRAVLGDIRLRLGVVEAVAAVVSAALRYQGADSDGDAATALQRCVCDALSAEMDRLDSIIAGGVS
jgi:hypothetical protein